MPERGVIPPVPRPAPWPAWFVRMDSARRGFTRALIASLVLHAVLLSLQFGLPEKVSRVSRDTLEVVLVNARSARKPDKAQARAQAHLDGGGNTEADRRAKTPLPPARREQPGDSLAEARRRVQELEAEQQRLLTQMRSQQTVAADGRERDTSAEPVSVRGADLAQSALAIARMEAQIERQIEEYQKRPRKKEFSPRTAAAVEAMYVENWRQKVERIGNLNYPEAAKGRLYGNLVLYVELRAEDGDVVKVEVARSSGHRILDEAAMRIVRLAAPYGAFPPEMKRSMDILMLARTWVFTRANELQTQ